MRKLLSIAILMIMPFLGMAQSYTYPNTDVVTVGEQSLVRMRTQSWQGFHAYLYLPKGYDSSSTERYPLICFYHGAGENGSLTKLLQQGLPKVIEDGHPPYSCTTPGDTTWFIVYSVSESAMGNAQTYIDIPADYRMLLDYYKIKIDTNKVYATGLSAGGNTTLQGAAENLNEFSAAVPMSTVWSNVASEDRPNIGNLWIWQIHGYNDATAYYGSAKDSILSHNEQYPERLALLTTFNGGHCCWTTYYNPTWKWTSNNANDIGSFNNMSLYDWMLTHVKSDQSNILPNVNAGSDQILSSGTTSTVLSGSATDADGEIISYAWTKVGSNSATITSPNNASTTITGLEDGMTYTFQLSATDDSGGVGTDQVVISINEGEEPVDTPSYKIPIDPDVKFWDGDTIYYQTYDMGDNMFSNKSVMLVNQQEADPKAGVFTPSPTTDFTSGYPTQPGYPARLVIDLGGLYKITEVWALAGAGTDTLRIAIGDPSNWSDTINYRPSGPLAFGWVNSGISPYYTRYMKIFWANKGNQKLRQLIFYGYLVGDSLTRTAPEVTVHKPETDMFHAIGMNSQFVPMEINLAGGTIRKYSQINWYDTAVTTFEHNIDSAIFLFDKNAHASASIYYRFPDSTDEIKSYVSPVNGIYETQKWAIENDRDYYYVTANRAEYFNANGYKKPIDPVTHPDRDSTKPESYDRYARMFWNWAAVFGNGDIPLDSLYQVGYPDSGNYAVAKFIETGNELDNTWTGNDGNWGPDALQAYTSAVYDGNAGTMGNRMGIKTVDPSIQVLEPALVYGPKNLNYTKLMYYYSHYRRPDRKAFAFDIFNFHLYSSDGDKGISPEADSVRWRLEKMADLVHEIDPDIPIWWTEFGYDRTGYRGSATAVPHSIGTLDSNTIQAAWLIRDFLAGAGICDRMTMYEVRNETKDNDVNAIQYATSGLTMFQFMGGTSNEFNYYAYPQYWYMLTFRNVLANYIFDTVQRGDFGDSVWVYRFKNKVHTDSVAYIVWCPTSEDKRITNLKFNSGYNNTACGVISFAHKKERGDSVSYSSDSEGYISFEINEIPKIILSKTSDSGGTLEVSGDVSAPVAIAGTNQQIRLPTDSVVLSGTGINGSGNIISHEWSKSSGGTANISSPDNYTSKVTGLSSGTYVFKLKVIDENDLSDSDNVTITVLPAYVGPSINAGPDQTLPSNTTITTLSASAVAGDGTIADYLWEQVSGPAISILSPGSQTTNVSGLANGQTYSFKITVTDSNDLSSSDTVSVTVDTAPSPPDTTSKILLYIIDGKLVIVNL